MRPLRPQTRCYDGFEIVLQGDADILPRFCRGQILELYNAATSAVTARYEVGQVIVRMPQRHSDGKPPEALMHWTLDVQLDRIG